MTLGSLGPYEVDHGVGRGVAAADDEDLRVVSDLDGRPRVLGAGRVELGQDGRLGVLTLLLAAPGVAVQRALGVVKGPVLDLGGVLEDGDGQVQGEPGHGREHGPQAAHEAQADEVVDGLVFLSPVSIYRTTRTSTGRDEPGARPPLTCPLSSWPKPSPNVRSPITSNERNMNHLATSAAPRVLFSSRMRSMARRTLPSMRGRKVLSPVSDMGFDRRRLYLR